MSIANDCLTPQTLEWIAEHRRTYDEVMEVCTSCPRPSLWESECAAGLIADEAAAGMVRLTGDGRAFLMNP
ncbi:MAG: hypothetical protein ACP5P4_05350 [Steroidobacteraceae bacterium]